MVVVVVGDVRGGEGTRRVGARRRVEIRRGKSRGREG